MIPLAHLNMVAHTGRSKCSSWENPPLASSPSPPADQGMAFFLHRTVPEYIFSGAWWYG